MTLTSSMYDVVLYKFEHNNHTARPVSLVCQLQHVVTASVVFVSSHSADVVTDSQPLTSTSSGHVFPFVITSVVVDDSLILISQN